MPVGVHMVCLQVEVLQPLKPELGSILNIELLQIFAQHIL
jgi:hypothetical protein